MLLCDSGGESLIREWEGKIKLVLLLCLWLQGLGLNLKLKLKPTVNIAYLMLGVMTVAERVVRDLKFKEHS